MPESVSRREAMTYGVGAIAAGALAGQHFGRTAGVDPLSRRPARRPQAVQLPQPTVLSSSDGELAVTLTGRPGVVDMNAPELVTTYTFDGVVPGHTWEVRPGDTLKVLLRNRLPAVPDKYKRMDRPRQWTNMNLHTHGLHVSPAGNADNVFLDLAPGGDQPHEIHLPPDHPAGCFWYHPHVHGAVTQQLRAGMAGLLIVRGDLDEVEEVAAAEDKVMVLQAIQLDDHYKLLDPIPDPGPGQTIWPGGNYLYTVNGVVRPRLRMYPGQVQRWRLLNAAANDFMPLRLRLEGHNTRLPFHVLAWDGLTLPAPDTEDVVLLSPGNRADVLVRAGKPGVYQLEVIDFDGLSLDMPMPGLPNLKNAAAQRVVLTVEVSGEGPSMSLPTALPAWNPPMLPIARHRDFSFTKQVDGTKFVDFGIDGKPFDMTAAPYRIPLNTAEEWTLRNATTNEAHVFHIHTNPFKVTKINGTALKTPLWRDTYLLSERLHDSITFESNFIDFTGKFVEHCHVVAHEDLGMMSSIEVVHP
jgi:FtsP/CotA-like multicopper oxidase with cupredoxin domain